MKKTVILLFVVLLIGMLAVPASAAGAASLIVSNATVYRGNSFTVTVYVSNLDACRTGGIEVSYGNGLELVGGEWLMGDTALKNFNASSKDGVFALNSSAKLSGNIFRMTFKVKDNAAFGGNKVSVKLLINNVQVKLEKDLTVTVACNHTYGAWAAAGESGHSRICSVCGNKESGTHAYDHDCDTDCNACGATRITTHAFEEAWTNDEKGHWHACKNCGEKSEEADHIPGPEAGEYTDQTCTVCTYVITPALGHQHRYDETFKSDAEQHWQVCLGCGEDTEHGDHGYDSDCDEVCDGCGYQRRVLHIEGDDWQTDDSSHWKLCEDCDSELDLANHIWNGGTVTQKPALNQTGKIVYQCGVCLLERSEKLPALTFTQAVPWWGFLLMGIGGGAVVSIGIMLLILVLKSKMKGEGKFSSARVYQEQ